MPTQLDPLDHWRTLPIKQQPAWPDADAVAAVSAEIATLPPLVFAGEVDNLRDRLARAASGNAFLLQGGDCAETFAGATAEQIRNRIKTVLQMAVVLTYGASMPVVKMGRMAGQFAKPRSSDTDTMMPIGTTVPRIVRVGIVVGEPLDFSRFEGMEGDRYILRSITDEIMVALQRLGEQEYDDVYASTVKDRLKTKTR